jgi:L-rhamnose-H+ transport protein
MGVYQFTSWAIHMIMLITFSIIVGVVLREWSRSRTVTKLAVCIAFVILVSAVLSLTYGNHLADLAAAAGA